MSTKLAKKVFAIAQSISKLLDKAGSTDDPIECSIAESMLENKMKVLDRLNSVQAFKVMIKEGNEYMHKFELPFYKWTYGEDKRFIVTMSFEYTEHGLKYAYAFCSPKDQYSRKIAKGLLGDKLMNEIDCVEVEVENWNGITENQIAYYGRILLEQSILESKMRISCISNGSIIPNSLERVVLRKVDSAREFEATKRLSAFNWRELDW
jgi:hypothetical protein